MGKFINYTWEEFHNDVERVARHYETYGPLIKNIYALPRGGLIFGVMLSHKLGVPLLLDKRKIGKNTLVVDDICDSGRTLKALLRNKKYFTIHTLWLAENENKIPVTYQHLKIDALKGHWIVFPWETEHSAGRNNTKF